MADGAVFRCGHPKTPENSYHPPSAEHAACRLCLRVKSINNPKRSRHKGLPHRWKPDDIGAMQPIVFHLV
jgi:hypothetical protein